MVGLPRFPVNLRSQGRDKDHGQKQRERQQHLIRWRRLSSQSLTQEMQHILDPAADAPIQHAF